MNYNCLSMSLSLSLFSTALRCSKSLYSIPNLLTQMKDLALNVYPQHFSLATSPSSFIISLYFVTRNSVQLVARLKHDCRLDPMIFGSRFRRAFLSSEKLCEPILLFCFLLHFTLHLFVDRDFRSINDDGLNITGLNKMDALD